jgi:hypothetical protein
MPADVVACEPDRAEGVQDDMQVIERQLCQMAELQDRLNRRVHPEWRSQGFEWYRATWIECAELLDHYGWKWWKRQVPDHGHVRLELVDIWHFGLSELVRDGRIGADFVDAGLRAEFARVATSLEPRAAVEALACETLATRRFSVARFIDLMAAMRLDFEELFRLYIGKNVLNEFRQAHGYNTGSYRKVWHGREDNEHLMELAQALDRSASAFADELYAALEARYLSSA